jgi:hypothetical protein
MSETEFRALIQEFIRDGLAELAPHDREWATARLIEPRRIEVVLETGGAPETELMWLVTDFVGDDRDDYRIVYDDALSTFGLILPGRDGRPVLIGLHGDFAQTVRGL